MTTPENFISSKFPTDFDSDQNLFLAHDSLRVTLSEDYDPNDEVVAYRTAIAVTGDTTLFPSTGIITLTEQCSDILERAISFYYTNKTSNTFEGLIPLEKFASSNTIVRPKGVTHVTQNVMAEHHNSIKDALIAIENFVGVKGTTDTKPFGETIVGRINFLRKLALSPRAWFTATNTIGLVPLTVTFKNESFRLGEGTITLTWDFGDQNSNISMSTISVSSVVPVSEIDVLVQDIDSGTIQKTYTTPGKYTTSLTVENEYGTDVVIFEEFINARAEAPIEAIMEFSYTSSQTFTAGSPSGGPYTGGTPPKIRSRTNKFIDILIPDGINVDTDRTYAGEELDEWNEPIDPIETYAWELGDDLPHANEKTTRASYTIGGLYDLVIRCDTRFGAYRITNYSQSIDIIEERNLWMFNTSGSTSTTNEFGLISETFKSGSIPYTVLRDSDFLNDTNNETQAKKEFKKNTGFAATSTISSGDHGSAVLFYSSGGIEGSSLSSQTVQSVLFEGFGGTITNDSIVIQRPWNWIHFPFDQKSYFLFGADPTEVSGENSSYQTKDIVDLNGALSLDSPVELINPNNFINGANCLTQHVTSGYDGFGEPNNGRFAVYRSTTKDSTGYFLRNDGVGNFFKLREFYRTEGVSTDPVINIRKLQDMTGQVKAEGELVSLTNGLFFFNNSGNITAFNIIDGIWEVGNSTSPFKSFQDTTIEGYSSLEQTLMAVSDNERIAYLSYDYSPNAFIKYNSVDKTFYGLGTRPSGEQWIVGIY